MARPREFDTDEAIESICERFWSDGFEATSISHLEEATGLARPRLYAAFGSKSEMLHHALDHYLETRIDQIFSRVDQAGPAGVAMFFKTFTEIYNDQPERAAMGCLMVNSIIELGRSDPQVAARADRYRKRVRGAFRGALEKTAKASQLTGDPESLSDLAFMMLMGLYIAVKGGASTEEINRLCAVAIHTVESWQVAPAEPVFDG